MSCIWSFAIRRLATKTSKLEKKEVPGAANTTPIKPRGKSSTAISFSLLPPGAPEAAPAGSGSIGSKTFPAPPAPELPALSTDEGGGRTCELSVDPFPDNEPKRPRGPELAPFSTEGGGGTTSGPAPESGPNLLSPAAPFELCS